MRPRYLLLLVASILLVDVSPSISRSVEIAAQTPNQSTQSANAYRNCQQATSAVVTIYAGREIGSGSIVDSEGIVLTNQHVVQEVMRSGGQKQIFVKTADGNRYPGQLLGTDARNDLALVKLTAQKSFPTLQLIGNEGIQAGQPVCAIGSPYGRAGVLSRGTFSGFRSNGDLKSAVLLRPGNSGGPLLNAQGVMVGINKAIWESATGENTGISFATSAVAVKNFIAQTLPQTARTIRAESPSPTRLAPDATVSAAPAKRSVAVTEPLNPRSTVPLPGSSAVVVPVLPQPTQSGSAFSRGQLGVILDTQNLVVQRVQFGSPAAQGGLQPGDRLVSVNGTQLSGFEELQMFLDRRPAAAIFTVRRHQQPVTLQVNF